ncbi:hypothetical protein [Nocardia sp. NPDC050175]|uniref:hypothetical protein n=1 Tax=Nocardia sp. NPDC050175 TaxID=3364317 RepID=UPI003798F20D
MIGMVWGATKAECDVPLPCDDLRPGGLQADRAITIDAPHELVYPWLCQLRVAPYSYDLLDHWGRRSPRHRDPRLVELEVGQPFMAHFELASFVPNQHITLVAGKIAVTYAVHPKGTGTRLVARVRMGGPRMIGRLLAVGDLVMMRKQLLTLQGLAEAENHAELRARLAPRR